MTTWKMKSRYMRICARITFIFYLNKGFTCIWWCVHKTTENAAKTHEKLHGSYLWGTGLRPGEREDGKSKILLSFMIYALYIWFHICCILPYTYAIVTRKEGSWSEAQTARTQTQAKGHDGARTESGGAWRWRWRPGGLTWHLALQYLATWHWEHRISFSFLWKHKPTLGTESRVWVGEQAQTHTLTPTGSAHSGRVLLKIFAHFTFNVRLGHHNVPFSNCD